MDYFSEIFVTCEYNNCFRSEKLAVKLISAMNISFSSASDHFRLPRCLLLRTFLQSLCDVVWP